MATAAQLVKTSHFVRSPDELLRAGVDVLLGVSPAAELALATLDIRSVFDLATSRTFAAAQRLLAAERDPDSAEARLNAVPADIVEAPTGLDAAKLARQPIAILRSIGAARAPPVTEALDVATVRDLALWPPFLAARQILAEAFFPERMAGVDPDAPPDLLPATGVYPTERVFHRKLLIDFGDAGADGLSPIEDAEAIDVVPGLLAPAGFQRLAAGALLTFSQSWFSQGLTLGQLLHSTSLAPGESTRIAMIDWTRRSRAAASEEILEAEQLANEQVHNRALSEVTSATATEFQSGRSTASATSSSAQAGAGFGLDLGLIAIGGSGAASTTTTDVMSAASTFGARDLAAQFAQEINDRTQQNASATRDRRASIVREVSQSEHESISTRAITNYNHMHALNVQYYEVVQAFRVVTQFERAEPCLFVPMKVLDFRSAATVERWRDVLARAALTPAIGRALIEFGSTRVSTQLPAGPGPSRPAVAGWKLEQIARLARAAGRLVVPTRTRSTYVSDSALLTGIALRDGSALRCVVRQRDGSEVAARDGSPAGFAFAEPVSVSELAAISVQHAGERELSTALTLHISLFGTLEALDVPIHLEAGGAESALQEIVRFEPGGQLRDLLDHLVANALHYSQAVYRSLDGAEIASLLARFTIRGLPLAQLVDPQPVAVSANCLVFRSHVDAAGGAAGAALAADLAAWRRFLARTGLERSVPRTEVVPLPSGGVFGEAVLGRSNAAERLQLERFWNWQDSPIPLVAPEIAAVDAGTRTQAENLAPGQLSAPVVSIQSPVALPEPTGIASAIAALMSANMFRDMSGLPQAAALGQATQQASASGATAAMQQAGQNLLTVLDQRTQRMRIAAELAAKLAGAPVSSGSGGGSGAPSSTTLTEQGGQLAAARAIDARGAAEAAPSGQAEALRAQTGVTGRAIARKVIDAAGMDVGEAAPSTPSTPMRGVGPKQAAPRAMSLTLQISSYLADPALFGPVPVRIHATLSERDGTRIWERQGAAAPRFTGSLRTSESRLFLNVEYRYELGWPQPTVVQTNGFTHLTVGAEAAQLHAAVWVLLDTRMLAMPDALAAPDTAALVAAIEAAGIHLRNVLAAPEVTPRPGGGFDIGIRLLKNVVVEQLERPGGPL